MFKILNAPYPLYSLNIRRLLAIIGIGAFVSFFLFVYQPFGTAEANFPNKNMFLLGYGPVISGSLIILELLATQFFFKKINEDKWTILKQVLWIILYTSVGLFASYLYKQWFFEAPISARGFFYFYRIAFSVALFPIIIIVLLDYIYQLKRHQTAASEINNQVGQVQEAIEEDRIEVKKQLQLMAENGKDQFECYPEALYYIKAADNYVEIVYEESGTTKKEIIRNSLQRLEKQIKEGSILRCHRSFLVNLENVTSVSGNAQGYKLHMSNSDIQVPVSRSKSKEILAAIRNQN